MTVYEYILQKKAANEKMLAVLIDPAKASLGNMVVNTLPDFVFVGGSTGGEQIEKCVADVRKKFAHVPVVLFPGNLSQFTPNADALLFLSLLSGRNAEMLIGEQVRAAKAVRESGVEAIGMGYVLVDGGRESSVEKASQTKAIPADDVDEIVATALAGELLGMKTIYLEAGSGAHTPITTETIQAVRAQVTMPLIVGGGIKTVEHMQAAFQAGADIVVIGNHFEEHPEEIKAFIEAKDWR